jgi:hypothetical protein
MTILTEFVRRQKTWGHRRGNNLECRDGPSGARSRPPFGGTPTFCPTSLHRWSVPSRRLVADKAAFAPSFLSDSTGPSVSANSR